MDILEFIFTLVFIAVIESVINILESMVAETLDSDALTWNDLLADPACQRLVF